MDEIPTNTILLVEDDQDDVLFMRIAMEKAGLSGRLRVVEDGRDAMDYLEGNGIYADRAAYPMPCLALVDLKLPRMLGIDLLRWIRSSPAYETMVIIIMSSSQQRSDIRQAYQLGANSYLVKPSNPLRLAEMIQALKAYWLCLNQPTAECLPSGSPE